MRLPDFDITPQIESLALEIVGLLDKMPALDTDATFLHLRKDNRIKSIQSSLAIEANSLSLQQVADIINGKKVIGDSREIREVKNAWAAYEKIGQYDPFSLGNIIESRKKKTEKGAPLPDDGVSVNVSANVSVKRRVLDLIKQHPEITVKQMAEALSLNERTVYRHIKQMKMQGHLARIGADKNGHWQILAAPQTMEDRK